MRVNLTEFTINASVSQTMKFAPFKLNGRYLPSMLKEYPQGSTPPGVCKFAQQALINVVEAHDSIIESRVFQTHHANKRRTADPALNKGDMVYLSTRNLNLQKGWVCKLCPKYIGPYKIDDAHLETSTYTLQLPMALQERRIHLTFHISLLWPYHENNDILFSNRIQLDPYDFGATDDTEWFMDEIIRH